MGRNHFHTFLQDYPFSILLCCYCIYSVLCIHACSCKQVLYTALCISSYGWDDVILMMKSRPVVIILWWTYVNRLLLRQLCARAFGLCVASHKYNCSHLEVKWNHNFRVLNVVALLGTCYWAGTLLLFTFSGLWCCVISWVVHSISKDCVFMFKSKQSSQIAWPLNLQNIGNHSLSSNSTHFRRPEYSATSAWETEISQWHL